MPKGCDINEFDLCVLFGNILDNALEACKRLQYDECCFVNIQAKTVKKCFLFEVKNSMNKAEKNTGGFTGQRPRGSRQMYMQACPLGSLLCGNKENPQEHGIGLLNVSDVVHRYNGVMNIENENGIFVASILIPLND